MRATVFEGPIATQRHFVERQVEHRDAESADSALDDLSARRDRHPDLVPLDLDWNVLVSEGVAETDGVGDQIGPRRKSDDQGRLRRPVDDDEALTVVEEHCAVAKVSAAVEIDGDLAAGIRHEAQATFHRQGRID
jgi:hypothetical protein